MGKDFQKNQQFHIDKMALPRKLALHSTMLSTDGNVFP
jgi:hypothetical protein